MARVKNRNTAPEIQVRKILHRLGYRFRLHRRDLPGSPDIVLPRHKKVIFVHGCFWHSHDCPRGKRPSTRQEFWNTKLDKNQKRDASNQYELQKLGWEYLIIWDCEINDKNALIGKLIAFLDNETNYCD